MVEDRLQELLAANRFLKIATTGSSMLPWIAAAYYAEEGAFELNVMLERAGRTVANIRSNPRVAVMVETGDPVGVFAQAEARAKVLEGGEERFRERLVAKMPESAAVVSAPSLVAVRILVDRWLITHISAGWIPSRELRRQQSAARTDPIPASP